MRIFKIMSKNSRALRTTTGVSLQQFDFLMRDVEKAYPEIERARLDRPRRKRRVGAESRRGASVLTASVGTLWPNSA